MQEEIGDWESVFLLHENQIRSFLYRLTAHKQDAEDILQDTYIRAKEKIATFEGKSTIKTWLFTIATNIARDNWRVKQRWVLEAQDLCKNEAITNNSQRERIINAFESQPEKRFMVIEHLNYCFTCIAKNLQIDEQLAILLSEIYQFKRKEIAIVLGKSESIVKHLLFNGRKLLQHKYEYRCALINKEGVCHQCAELNNYFNKPLNSNIPKFSLGQSDSNKERFLSMRFKLISQIDPLTTNGAVFHDTLLQILQEAIIKK